jgi:hypothetical protein
MSGEFENIVLASLKGLISRQSKHAAPVGTACANCETPIQGRFCHVCGQVADNHHRSILHMAWEAVEGLFHLDGRLWRTVPALFFRPGQLARDYMEGRLARHVPPFRMFLVTLLMFILAAEALTHRLEHSAEHSKAQPASHVSVAVAPNRDTPQRRLEADAKLAKRQVEATRLRGLLSSISDGQERAEAEAELKTFLDDAQEEHDDYLSNDTTNRITVRGTDVLTASPEERQALANELRRQMTAAAKEAKGAEASNDPSRIWLERSIAAVENPGYYMTAVFGWGHRLAILLLPMLASSLGLAYLSKKQFFIYDHLLVSMNILSFSFVMLAIGCLLPQPVVAPWFGVVSVWSLINIYSTLRQAYGSSVTGAVIKTGLIAFTTIVSFVLLLAALLTVALTQL